MAIAAAGLLAVQSVGTEAVECPPGTVPNTGPEPWLVAPDQADRLPPEYSGPFESFEWAGDCKPDRLESFAELAARNAQNDARLSAPFMQPAQGARWSAAQQRQAMLADGVTVRGSDGVATMHGRGPVNFSEEPYDTGSGIQDSTGRIDDFFYDEANNRLFAAIGTSGVWMSEDRGATWTSIGDNLPTNIASAVTWTPSGGPDGTVAVVTGEHTFGGASYTGLGVFFSDDLGESWTRAEGPFDGTLGFAIEVDPTNPDVIYAATGKGLWRSEDAGRTYEDVLLPVGTCAGHYDIQTCNYAHFVTDVIVQEPGGVGEDTEGGTVIAAVGYRAGQLEDISGEFVHSEGNGVYRSETGEPGTFERLSGLDDAAGGAERLGRIEFGPAIGPEQDHDILYAIVEDAVLFNGGPQYVPIPDGVDPTGLISATPTFLNGIYISEDFGESWTALATDDTIGTLCTVNQSVFCIPGAIEPGVQSWYNMWIEPDPTRAQGGVPTRVVFGLEEVFQSRLTALPLPANTPATTFEVIGAYYGGADCLLVATDCMVSSNLGITTTHPDQHDGIWLPILDDDGEPTGGVELLVGHDGGLSRQVDPDGATQFSQQTWQLDQEDNGLQTLLPYAIAVANDGTGVAGLQDNGTMLVEPNDDLRQFEVLGADGTIAAIDPEDSDYAYASSQGNALLEVTSDRFLSSTALNPVPSDNSLFVPPLDMNPLNADHIITGGTQVVENLGGREATVDTWTQAIDLGTTEREPLFDTDEEPPPRQTSAVDLYGDAAYIGYCAPCHILQTAYPYDTGIATNIGAEELPEPGTEKGWHIAAADGLPDRYVTDLAIDPYDPTGQTVYATLGGYTRKWVPAGTGANEATNIGDGHVFVSFDAGETFTDISGNLPDTPVLTVEQRGSQLLVGTDLGPFISSDLSGTTWAPLGGDTVPSIPVTDIQMKADDPDVAYLGVYGRGIMRYDFPEFTPGEVRRLAGDQRVQTAVEISSDTFEAADVVVIARADDYADALAGAPLAHAEDAPLLLTGRDGLNPAAAEELVRLGASRVILLGGDAALSPQVEADVQALGVDDVTRVAGPNRFATAAEVAALLGGSDQDEFAQDRGEQQPGEQEPGDQQPGEPTQGANAWIVKGNDVDPTRGWPDAMSIAPVAARSGQPILLTETDRLPQETIDALEDAGITDARIVGGPAAVNTAVEGELADLISLGDRVAGANRFETNVAAVGVGLTQAQGLANTWLARADDFADALSAGPSVAATGGSLVLVDSQDLGDSGPVEGLLERNACQIQLARVAGGTAAISDQVQDQVEALLAACDGSIPDPPEQAIVPVEGGGEENLPETTVAGPFGFESDAEGWTVATAGNPASTWTRGTPGHESEQSFQVVPYYALADTTLTSPPIDVGEGRVAVSFFYTLDMEGGGFDEMAVEYSDDGGQTWTQIRSFGARNPGYPEFGEGVVTFTPSSDTVQVRFRVFADYICDGLPLPGVCTATMGYEGVRVDDVTILQ